MEMITLLLSRVEQLLEVRVRANMTRSQGNKMPSQQSQHPIYKENRIHCMESLTARMFQPPEDSHQIPTRLTQ